MEEARVLGRCYFVRAGCFEVGVFDGIRVKLDIGHSQLLVQLGRRARTRYISRHTTSDEKITIVIRSETSVATRARPKMDVLLSAFSLRPSYRYSPPKRDRTGLSHDRLNIMMIQLGWPLGNRERGTRVRVLIRDGSNGSLEGRSHD